MKTTKYMRHPFSAGQRFGRLTVIREMPRASHGARQVECVCDCGSGPRTYLAANVYQGKSASCGCVATEKIRETGKRNALAFGVAERNAVLNAYVQSAKRRGILFSLSDVEFDVLCASRCAYCGSSPSREKINRRGQGSFTYNGIDRLDNAVGYVGDNCVSCCWTCNRMKHDLSVDEFLKQVVDICQNRGLK